MSDFKRIKERINLIEYVGRNYPKTIIKLNDKSVRMNPCPFCGHNDCMTIFDHSYKCYSCDESGDIFSLVEKTKNITKKETLLELAKDAGYQLKKESKEQESKRQKEEKKQKTIEQIFELTKDYYTNCLLKNKFAIKLLKVKKNRPIATLKKYFYGYSDGKLYKFLKSKSYSDEILLSTGIVKEKDKKIKDTFPTGLFIYPIFYQGKVVDFYCKDRAKKYISEKSKKGLNFQIRKEYKLDDIIFYNKEGLSAKQVILVEGQEDLVTIKELLGKTSKIEVVAILGGLSENQINYIEALREGKTTILAFDPDSAGEKYEYKIMLALAGKGNLKKLIWDFSKGDIDDFLRDEIKCCNADIPKPIESFKIKEYTNTNKNLQNAFIKMVDNAEDIIAYSINNLPDMSKMNTWGRKNNCKPFYDIMANIEDEISYKFYAKMLAVKLGSASLYLSSVIQKVKAIIQKREDDEKKESDEIETLGVKRFNNLNKYVYVTDRGIYPITNFVIKIEKQIRIDKEIHYLVRFLNEDNELSDSTEITPEECVNSRKFSKKVKATGTYHYFGDDRQLAAIWMIEEKRAGQINTLFYYNQYGYIEEEDLWLFDNCVIQKGKIYPADSDGIIPVKNNSYRAKEINIYSGDRPTLNIDFHPTKEWIDDIIKHFWIMWDHKTGDPRELSDNLLSTYKGILSMGYIAALAYRPDWIKKERMYPFLMAFGPSETGKSKAVQLLMYMLGWHNEAEDWTDATAYGISQALDMLSSLPYWMDEYINKGDRDNKQRDKIAILRNAWTLAGSGKGGLHNKRQTTKVNGTIILSGQNRVDDRATLSRFVVLRKGVPTPTASKSYYHLVSEKAKLSAIFAWILQHKTEKTITEYFKSVEQYKKVFAKELKKRNKKYRERAVLNYSIIAAGFTMYDFTFLNNKQTQEFYNGYFNWLIDQLIEDEERVNNQEILYDFFSSVEVLFPNNMSNYVKREGDLVYLSLPHIYNAWRTNRNRLGGSEIISQNDLRDYMSKDSLKYWVELKDSRVKFYGDSGHHRWRAICLRISKLPKNLKNIMEGWNDSE